MSTLSVETLRAALAPITNPQSGQSVLAEGRIAGLSLRGGQASFAFLISPEEKDALQPVFAACEAALKALPGITHVTAVLTAERSASAEKAPLKPAQWNREPLPHVARVLAVASGKGGVGKSTTTVNLALALTQMGKRVGILDADIYGPSIPHMLGIAGQPQVEDGMMQPLQGHGIACNSMGLLSSQAAVLRGPMISKALAQLLRLTRWGTAAAPLDMLLIDMPPGTGDIHLSMAQQVPLDGALIVTTPQQVALLDARKCAEMFAKLGVPIAGVIENMSGGPFGAGGGARLAQEIHAPLLGNVPIDPEICAQADNGRAYAGKNAACYAQIAQHLGA